MVVGETGPEEAPVPLFELHAVGYDVPGRAILRGLDLSIAARKVVGLIGPNGSGKSTLVKLLARQTSPSAGRLLFRGRPAGEAGDRAFARQVAYLPQFMPAADGMNVREFVSLGRFPWHGTFGRFTDKDRAKVDAAIEQTGLGTFDGRLVDTLSGGERQRVWLAMLLAQDAGCLILDEPTSALDIAHQADMLALVRELSKRRALSVVIVLHDVNMAARTCDRLIALGDGCVVADGPPEAIMRPDVLQRIYGLPMGILAHPGTGAPVSYVL